MTIDSTRQLGQGFGPNNEFYIWLGDKNKGITNPLSQSQLEKLKDWLEKGEEKEGLRDIFAAIIQDVLIDMDIPELAKIKIPEHLHAIFSNEDYFDRLDPRFVLSLRNFYPGLHGGMIRTMLQQPLSEKEKLLFAYLIPALIDVMDKEDRLTAAYGIGVRLHPKHFHFLFDPNYFKVDLDPKNLKFENNGRTLRFLPMHLTAKFRGFLWKYDHSHIHLGKEREYVLLPSDEDTVGEIHSVFRRKVIFGGKEYKQFMAVGVPLAIGKHNNPGIESLISGNGTKINFFELFLSTFDPDNALYHTWGSLISKTPAFIDGLRFSLSNTPIEVSRGQHDRLLKIFEEKMVPLDRSKILDPIDRRAYRPKPLNTTAISKRIYPKDPCANKALYLASLKLEQSVLYTEVGKEAYRKWKAIHGGYSGDRDSIMIRMNRLINTNDASPVKTFEEEFQPFQVNGNTYHAVHSLMISSEKDVKYIKLFISKLPTFDVVINLFDPNARSKKSAIYYTNRLDFLELYQPQQPQNYTDDCLVFKHKDKLLYQFQTWIDSREINHGDIAKVVKLAKLTVTAQKGGKSVLVHSKASLGRIPLFITLCELVHKSHEVKTSDNERVRCIIMETLKQVAKTAQGRVPEAEEFGLFYTDLFVNIIRELL